MEEGDGRVRLWKWEGIGGQSWTPAKDLGVCFTAKGALKYCFKGKQSGCVRERRRQSVVMKEAIAVTPVGSLGFHIPRREWDDQCLVMLVPQGTSVSSVWNSFLSVIPPLLFLTLLAVTWSNDPSLTPQA